MYGLRFQFTIHQYRNGTNRHQLMCVKKLLMCSLLQCWAIIYVEVKLIAILTTKAHDIWYLLYTLHKYHTHTFFS